MLEYQMHATNLQRVMSRRSICDALMKRYWRVNHWIVRRIGRLLWRKNMKKPTPILTRQRLKLLWTTRTTGRVLGRRASVPFNLRWTHSHLTIDWSFVEHTITRPEVFLNVTIHQSPLNAWKLVQQRCTFVMTLIFCLLQTEMLQTVLNERIDAIF